MTSKLSVIKKTIKVDYINIKSITITKNTSNMHYKIIEKPNKM